MHMQEGEVEWCTCNEDVVASCINGNGGGREGVGGKYGGCVEVETWVEQEVCCCVGVGGGYNLYYCVVVVVVVDDDYHVVV